MSSPARWCDPATTRTSSSNPNWELRTENQELFPERKRHISYRSAPRERPAPTTPCTRSDAPLARLPCSDTPLGTPAYSRPCRSRAICRLNADRLLPAFAHTHRCGSDTTHLPNPEKTAAWLSGHQPAEVPFPHRCPLTPYRRCATLRYRPCSHPMSACH